MKLLFLAFLVLTVLSSVVLSLMSQEELERRVAGRQKLSRMPKFDRGVKPSHGTFKSHPKPASPLFQGEGANEQRGSLNRRISNGVNRRRMNPLSEQKRTMSQAKLAAAAQAKTQRQPQVFQSQQKQPHRQLNVAH